MFYRNLWLGAAWEIQKEWLLSGLWLATAQKAPGAHEATEPQKGEPLWKSTRSAYGKTVKAAAALEPVPGLKGLLPPFLSAWTTGAAVPSSQLALGLTRGLKHCIIEIPWLWICSIECAAGLYHTKELDLKLARDTGLTQGTTFLGSLQRVVVQGCHRIMITLFLSQVKGPKELEEDTFLL